MTWSIQIDGHDDLETEAKEAFENGLVAKVVELVADIKSGAGITVSRAQATTNTTGAVDVLGATEGNAPTADAAQGEPGEDVPDEPADEEVTPEGE
jgi:hypothetical protein